MSATEQAMLTMMQAMMERLERLESQRQVEGAQRTDERERVVQQAQQAQAETEPLTGGQIEELPDVATETPEPPPREAPPTPHPTWHLREKAQQEAAQRQESPAAEPGLQIEDELPPVEDLVSPGSIDESPAAEHPAQSGNIDQPPPVEPPQQPETIEERVARARAQLQQRKAQAESQLRSRDTLRTEEDEVDDIDTVVDTERKTGPRRPHESVETRPGHEQDEMPHRTYGDALAGYSDAVNRLLVSFANQLRRQQRQIEDLLAQREMESQE